MGSRRPSDFRVLRLCGVLIVLLTGTLLAAPAEADQVFRHTALESSEPAADSVLTESPGSITLTFTEAVQNIGTELTVTGPDGQIYPTTPDVVGADVRAAVPPLAGSGQFVIGYRVTAADGDAVSGEVVFQLQQPTPETSAEPITSTVIDTSAPESIPVPTESTTTPPPSTSSSASTTGTATTGTATTGTATTGTATTDAAPSPTTTSAAGTSSDSGPSGWLWVLVAAIVIVAVGVVLLIRRRRVSGGAPH